jgi:FixJ family two-component response regulator
MAGIMLERPRNISMAEKKPHICILEDDSAVRDSLCWMLERNGFSTRAFSSPNEFLMSREIDAYDCLVIDLGLPGMNGLELLELLRARTCWTPAILIAASADAQTEPRMRKAGASELLMKPIAPDMLLAALRKAAGRGLVRPASPRT